jgi:hypothetical protein
VGVGIDIGILALALALVSKIGVLCRSLHDVRVPRLQPASAVESSPLEPTPSQSLASTLAVSSYSVSSRLVLFCLVLINRHCASLGFESFRQSSPGP